MIIQLNILKTIKAEADALAKTHLIPYTVALEQTARQFGFHSWHHAKIQSIPNPDGTPATLTLDESHSLRFYLPYRDSNWDWVPDKALCRITEDTDLANAVFNYGLTLGLNEATICTTLAHYSFFRHKTARPVTAFEAVKIITDDFTFPVCSIFIDNQEHCQAFDPAQPDTPIWQGQSVFSVFSDGADF